MQKELNLIANFKIALDVNYNVCATDSKALFKQMTR